MAYRDAADAKAYRKANSKAICARVRAWRKKHPGARTEEGRRYYVKHGPEIKARQKAWRIKNLDRQRRYEAEYAREYRARKTEGQRLRMKRFKAKQEAILVEVAGRRRANACELCGDSQRTVFDHDHATGAFRGWLCQRCNRALGQVKDNPELLRKMIRWIMEGGIGHGEADKRATEGAPEIRLCGSE